MISVIMGVLCPVSKLNHLVRAIQSIQEQNYQDFELLICDDGSDNKIKLLLDEMADCDYRIRLIRSSKAITLSQKLNLCYYHARGEYIARMDDDDYSYENRFERQLIYLGEHPEIDFVGCNVNQVSTISPPRIRVLPEYPVPKDFLFVMPFIHPTLVFKKKALEIVNGYSESKWCTLCEDYDLLLRMYENGLCGANIQEVLFDYTITNTQLYRRAFRYRINEAVIRYHHFRNLRMLPGGWPYIIKPIATAFLPVSLLNRLKTFRSSIMS